MIRTELYVMFTFLLTVSLYLLMSVATSHAVTVHNPGFNDLSGWSTSNDATLAHPGGVAPWAWPTPVVASVVVNASETVLPPEGTGMGITYAGADRFTQSVEFPSDGEYTLSVSVNSITGTSLAQMVDGEFQFFVGGSSSPIHVVPNAEGWETYSWTTNVTAGIHDVGVRNTLGAPYAIAYDNFAIVPEPSALLLSFMGLATCCVRHRERV